MVAVTTLMRDSQPPENRFCRTGLADMIKNWVFRGAAIGNKDQERKLVALGERDHAGAHTQHPCILNKHCRSHPAKPSAASDGERFFFMGRPHQPDAGLSLDAHQNLAKPAVGDGNGRAEAEALQSLKKLRRAVTNIRSQTGRIHYAPSVAAIRGGKCRLPAIVDKARPLVDPRWLVQDRSNK